LTRDVDGSAVICGNHELNRVMLRDVDEPCVVDHEEVVAAVLEWFTVEVAVDVVFDFTAARQVNVIRPDGWYLVDCVADSV
jgi:hypothetical protein